MAKWNIFSGGGEWIDVLPDSVYDLLGLELPEQESLDDYIEFILPKIYYLGRDLSDTTVYTDTPWLEIREDAEFHEHIVHIFKPFGSPMEIKAKSEDDGPDYIRFINGIGSKGKWQYIEEGNMLIIKHAAVTPFNQGMSEFTSFHLKFLNSEFLILERSGRILKGEKKYMLMAREELAKFMEWRETIDLMYNPYRYNVVYISLFVILIVLFFIIFYFSIR